MNLSVPQKYKADLFWLLLSTGVICAFSPNFFPFTWDDSATYIETARNFKEGRGLVRYANDIDPVEADYTPLTSFPVGYPLMIYGLSLWGIDMTTAAVVIPRLSYVALPCVLFWMMSFLGGNVFAFFVTAAFILMKATIYFALSAMTDVPYLALTLLSFLLIFRALETGKAGGQIVLSGVIAGLALSIRNVGYSIPLGVGAGFTAGLFLGMITKKEYMNNLRGYFAGFVAGYIPFILRNFIVFGKLQPYHMRESDLGLYENVRQYIWALLISFGGHEGQSRAFLFLCAVAFIAASVYFLRNKTRLLRECRSRKCIAWLIMLFYLFAGSAVVIVARTKNLWGETINDRHLMQYNWIYLAGIFGICAFFLKKNRYLKNFNTKLGMAVLLALFLVPQAGMLLSSIRYQKEMVSKIRPIVEAKSYFGQFPQNTFIVSTLGPKLKILLERHVRQLPKDISPEELSSRVCPKRPLAVILLDYNVRNYPLWDKMADMPPGYRIVTKQQGYTILFHPQTGDTLPEGEK